jgi:hypothetical protein
VELKKEDAEATIGFLKRYGSGRISMDGQESSVGAALLAIILSSAVKGDSFSAYESGNGDLKIELMRDGEKKVIVFVGLFANKEEA